MARQRDMKIGPCLHNSKCYGQFASHWVGSNISCFKIYAIFFLCNYHDCFKNPMVQIQAEYILHLFHHDLVTEQYKKEREGILLKSFQALSPKYRCNMCYYPILSPLKWIFSYKPA